MKEKTERWITDETPNIRVTRRSKVLVRKHEEDPDIAPMIRSRFDVGGGVESITSGVMKDVGYPKIRRLILSNSPSSLL